MSYPIQNRDRLHVQDHQDHAEAWELATPAEQQAEDYAALKVFVTNAVETTTGAAQFGAYETIVVPPATVQQLLPHDPLRQFAYITPIDEAIVLGTTLEQCQGANNLVAAVPNPSGAYLPALATTPPIRHSDPVYCVNTHATLPTRVTVLVERGNVA
jgi:hypothetical protein